VHYQQPLLNEPDKTANAPQSDLPLLEISKRSSLLIAYILVLSLIFGFYLYYYAAIIIRASISGPGKAETKS